ncbi:amino acid ABC transporter permease [Cellulomonas sp. HZM]|uniref:amino acid ABC transporter permease n=1 Tax=Cellulomonas sp. HZM TaxID=1454010 RepID=UPI00054F99B1|nr:amino acid ABC transporter permease [Cellulomonas sp. HZM]
MTTVSLPSTAVSTQPAGEPVAGPTSGLRREELELLRVRPARHPGRWTATAVVAVLLAMVVNSLLTNPQWDWDVVGKYLTWPSIVDGVWGTIRLTATAAAIGFGLGTVLALMRLSRSPLLQSVAWLYVWVFRSVPLILQLLLWYNLAYLYPTLSIGIPFGPGVTEFATSSVIGKFGAAILGLGLSQAAYSSEIVRAGILGVDQGQHEAAASLGIPRARQQWRIVLPQAMRTIVPTSVNEIIGLLKGTSVVYVLAYGELFYTVGVIYGRNTKVVALLLVAGIWYLLLTTVLTVVQFYLERHYARGALRTLPPTPLQKARWTVQSTWATLAGRPVPASVPAGWTSGNRTAGHLTRTSRTPRRDVGGLA